MSFTISVLLSASALFFSFCYMLNGILLHFGLHRRYKSQLRMPTVSVLIAARNEAEHIEQCLKSISNLDYPRELLQILILNDRSEDQTREIAGSFAAEHKFMRVIDITDDKHGLKGKMNVLAQGITQSSGEVILVTDADCTVPRGWIKELVAYFDSSVAMVGGLTVLRGSSLFARIQSFDWIFLQGIASATAGLYKPVSILGNNFAFRRQVYEQIGGFKDIGFSLTEDLALMRRIHMKTDYTIAYPLTAGHRIYSEPKKTMSDVYQQRLRWISGKADVSAWGYWLLGIAFLCKLLLFLCLLTLNIDLMSSWALVLMLLTELFLILQIFNKTQQLSKIGYWPIFTVYYFLYSLIFGFSQLLPQHVQWKSRSYRSDVKSD